MITDVGRKLLADHSEGISQKDLLALAGDDDAYFTRSQLTAMDQGGATVAERAEPELDPREPVEQGIERIHAEVAADLLARLHGKEPAFFEAGVVQLLDAMGYGGADRSATVTSPSNVGGIDGIIDQDTLGLCRPGSFSSTV